MDAWYPSTATPRTVDENGLERRVERIRALIRKERLQVLDVCKLLEVPSDADLVPVLGRGLETDRVVQLLDARNGDSLVARRVDMPARCRGNADGGSISCNLGRLLLVRVEAEGRAEALQAREHGRGLNEIDVAVKVLWDAVGCRTDDSLTTGVVGPDMIFLARDDESERVETRDMYTYGFEHLLSLADWDLHENPVSGRRTRQVVLIDAMRSKPFIHEVDALVLRRDERLDLFLGKVLAVAVMERIAGKPSSEDRRSFGCGVYALT